MKLLLDTHIWLWSLLEPAQLAPAVARALADAENELWLSPVSIWEVLLLAEKQRVRLPGRSEDWVAESLSRFTVQEAPLTHAVAMDAGSVGLPHGDPADRFLVATARVYELILVTADERLIRTRGVRTMANRQRQSTSSPTT